MSYEPDVKEVSVVANAIGWVLYADGQPSVDISDEQLEKVLSAADHALKTLYAFREHSQKTVG